MKDATVDEPQAKTANKKSDAVAAKSKAVPEKSSPAYFDLTEYPYPEKLDRATYEAEKAALQVELLKVQL